MDWLPGGGRVERDGDGRRARQTETTRADVSSDITGSDITGSDITGGDITVSDITGSDITVTDVSSLT